MKKVSACIVNYNSDDSILKTIETLKQHTRGVELQLFVSDNGSTNDSMQKIKQKFPDVVAIYNQKNSGFGAGNNAVIPRLHSDYHLLVNPDIEIDYDILSQLTAYMEAHPEIGILTPKVLNMDGTEQHLPKRKPRFIYLLSGRLPGLKRFRNHFTRADELLNDPVPIDFCTGCFMFLRTDLFLKVGGFDERYFLYFEDADLTRKIQTYAQTIYFPHAYVYHQWHRASGKNLKFLLIHIKSMFQYFIKWFGK